MGLWDVSRLTYMWFVVPVARAQSGEEYDSAPREYHIVVKIRNDEIEMRYLPQVWADSESVPAAYKLVPKE
jgi:hypothetical protein